MLQYRKGNIDKVTSLTSQPKYEVTDGLGIERTLSVCIARKYKEPIDKAIATIKEVEKSEK